MATLNLTVAKYGSIRNSDGNFETRTSDAAASGNGGHDGYIGFTGLHNLPLAADVSSAALTLSSTTRTFTIAVYTHPQGDPPTTTAARFATTVTGSGGVFDLGSLVEQARANGSWTASSHLGLKIAMTTNGTFSASSFVIDYLEGNAGPDQTVDPFTTVTLSGTPAGIAWEQVSGEPVTLSGTGSTRTFKAPAKMTQHQLVFKYGADTMTVTVRAAKHAIIGAGATLTPARFIVI